MKITSILIKVGVLFTLFTGAAQSSSATLETMVFNPQEKSMFPVSSVLITGPKEAILVDAQFQRNDAQSVVEMIRKSGKNLTTIYISHGDPDYYFGLDVITAAYPHAKVVSTANTQAYIKASMEQKKAYWGPILKENAPQKLVVPDVLQADTLMIDGEKVQVIGVGGHDPKHTFVWIPSIKTMLGGVVVFNNMHVFLADTQTPESRLKWFKTLDSIELLKPKIVIPGHMLGDKPMTIDAVNFTRKYIKDFEEAAASSTISEELIAKMKSKYPTIGGDNILVLSAKVIMGEMKWGQ
ncbi:MBL fold metallo-hydrolase [Saccharophagus degradans]|uniref:MBL fold metallo-hydrolase n=1 Tax=Saccharophagus degradans TaxID=86304 RepID=UPI001C09925F|nr:MBL fold metallo-hydrolase [Saccharophagus degradans]MBU2985605.1 MBL fold metallo-hydrolase [Saccharophagus degradans]WGO96563.1 MBL fold metallo-hydrolase [Saccharophagus degradans]